MSLPADRLPLTERQTHVYEFIRFYIRSEGRPPTLADIGREFKISSSNGVHRLVVALEAKGYVTRRPNEARGLSLVDDEEPQSRETSSVLMLKTSEGAGRLARPLTSEIAEYPLPRTRRPLLVDPSLLPDDCDLDACFGVVAGDDGLLGDNIRKGDLLVVEETEWTHVPSGAIVAVLIYDRLVARRFEHVNGRLHFRVSNRNFSDQSARGDDPEYFVLGRVVAMMRSLA
jgi:repressor LexA